MGKLEQCLVQSTSFQQWQTCMQEPRAPYIPADANKLSGATFSCKVAAVGSCLCGNIPLASSSLNGCVIGTYAKGAAACATSCRSKGLVHSVIYTRG